ncbi:MAG TPA: hypothetical protein VKT19_02345 [Steroidobacteraceae bacterium]|nr:hypothetical protein [Steroidobacteraceae bacterium]
MPAKIACLLMLGLTLAACAGRERVRSEYIGTASMNEDQITQLLYQQGYTSITDLHKNGNDWIGAATHNGQAVNFDIDKDGKINTR